MGDERFAEQPTGVARLRIAADAARRASPREKYLKDWKLVKRARFNAAKRFERKHYASTVAFALAGIFGFLIPIGTGTFQDGMSAHTKNVLDFTGMITGSLSLVLGLIEQAKDYAAKARQFDQCGLSVNKALRRLTILSSHSPADLEAVIAEYEQALAECGENHDDIDNEIAHAQQDYDDWKHAAKADPLPPKAPHLRRRLAFLRLREATGIYGLYAAIWILPLIIGWLIWAELRPPTNAASPNLPRFTTDNGSPSNRP